jgi:hypothetical protein
MDQTTLPGAIFARIRPLSDAYAALPVSAAFNWSDSAIPELEGEWYMVAFRSVRRPGVDEERLREYDDRAAEDAQEAPGFVHYFKGPLGEGRECMSFCLWNSRLEARTASARAPHLEAVSLIHEMYEQYTLEFWRVTKRLGSTAFEFEPYDQVVAA